MAFCRDETDERRWAVVGAVGVWGGEESHGSLHFFNYEQNSITVQPHALERHRKLLKSSDINL